MTHTPSGPDLIYGFTGANRWLSNFWPTNLTYEDLEYRSSEHAFAAAKTLDPHRRRSIANAETPGVAKQLGRAVALRPDWDTHRFTAMWEIVCAKFSQNPELADRLAATGKALLVEANTWHDQTWGTCTCARHENIWGSNLLGILLMQCRDTLA
jgi:ribA/ribD-fused uncharacterized protein